jgi:hypothetical protein
MVFTPSGYSAVSWFVNPSEQAKRSVGVELEPVVIDESEFAATIFAIGVNR